MRIGAWRRKRCAEPLCRRGLPCGAAVPPCGSPRALPCGSPRALPRGICPCVVPPSVAAVYAPGRFFMRAGGLPCGGVPLASPGLNPGGTYSPNKKGTRRGACLVCRLPTLPFRKPQGGLGGFGRLPALPLALFFAPIPPPALAERSSPPGKGETQSLFRRGLRPRHPCTKPFAALACLCLSDTPRGGVPPAALARPAGAVPGGRCAPAALARPAPGERTISNAAVASATDSSISPGPPSPWLPALPIGSRFLSVLRRTAGSLRGVPAWQRL